MRSQLNLFAEVILGGHMARDNQSLVPNGKRRTVALFTAVGVLDDWSASRAQACNILRISSEIYDRARNRAPDWLMNLNQEQMHRVNLVLKVHAALRQVFNNPENVCSFPTRVNDGDFFEGRTPLDVISRGDFESLLETLRQVEAMGDG